MSIRWLHDEVPGTMTYLQAVLGAGEAALVDPFDDAMPVPPAMLSERQLCLRAMLRTHEAGQIPHARALLSGAAQGPGLKGGMPPGTGSGWR